MRMYITHHMLGYFDLMLVYDTVSKNTTNGGLRSSYCHNQWYAVNNNPFSSNASSLPAADATAATTATDATTAAAAAMMMIPIAGIDMGSRKYGVVSLHYRASDQRMAMKNWEPQSWTTLIEGTH